MSKQYFVIGDADEMGLDELVELLTRHYQDDTLRLVSDPDLATHYLIVARSDGDVQLKSCSAAGFGQLPDLPVVLVMTEFRGLPDITITEISLECAMGPERPTPEVNHAF
jgi:hypothetical protein